MVAFVKVSKAQRVGHIVKARRTFPSSPSYTYETACRASLINIYTSIFFDAAECFSGIFYCTAQLLDDVGLESVIFLESYNIEKLAMSLSII